MNEDAEGKEPRQVLEESREILKELQDRNNRLIDRWEEFARGSESGEEAPAASSEGTEPPVLPEFGGSLLRTFSEFADLWEALLDTRGELDAIARERSSLQSEVARFSEQVMLLGRTRAEVTEEKHRLEKELGEATKANEEDQVAIKYLENQVEKLEKNLETLSHDVAAREVEKQADGEAIENLKAELDQNRKEREELTEKAATQGRDLENLRSVAAPLREENLHLTELVASLKTDLTETRNSTVSAEDFGKTKQELESVRAERAALEEQGKSQIEKILKMEEELTVLRSKSQQDEIERLNAEKSFQEAEIRIRKIESENQDLEDLLEKAKREIDIHKRVQPTAAEEPGAFAESPEGAMSESQASGPSSTVLMDADDLSVFETDPAKVESLALAEDARIFEGEEGGEDLDSDGISPIETVEGVSAQEEETAEVEPAPVEREPEKADEPDVDSPLEEGEVEDLDLAARIEMPLDTGGDGYPDLVQQSEHVEEERDEMPVPETEGDEIAASYLPEVTETPEEFRSVVEGEGLEEDMGATEETPVSGAPLPEDELQAIRVAQSENRDLIDSEEALEGEADTLPADEVDLPKEGSFEFPYPEITGVGMESFRGRSVLLVGGDERFRSDYEHLFGLAGANLVYFPGIVHLEKNGIKRHVRESDVVVIFGAAVDEPGVFRLRNVTSDYGRYLVEHRSSGLVSLYHQLQEVNRDL